MDCGWNAGGGDRSRGRLAHPGAAAVLFQLGLQVQRGLQVQQAEMFCLCLRNPGIGLWIALVVVRKTAGRDDQRRLGAANRDRFMPANDFGVAAPVIGQQVWADTGQDAKGFSLPLGS